MLSKRFMYTYVLFFIIHDFLGSPCIFRNPWLSQSRACARFSWRVALLKTWGMTTWSNSTLRVGVQKIFYAMYSAVLNYSRPIYGVGLRAYCVYVILSTYYDRNVQIENFI